MQNSTSVSRLIKLGQFPNSENVIPDVIAEQEEILNSIAPPISDQDAMALVELFGPDDYFGCAWSLVHLIESAPNWPIEECLADSSNEWIQRLRNRLQ